MNLKKYRDADEMKKRCLWCGEHGLRHKASCLLFAEDIEIKANQFDVWCETLLLGTNFLFTRLPRSYVDQKLTITFRVLTPSGMNGIEFYVRADTDIFKLRAALVDYLEQVIRGRMFSQFGITIALE